MFDVDVCARQQVTAYGQMRLPLSDLRGFNNPLQELAGPFTERCGACESDDINKRPEGKWVCRCCGTVYRPKML